MAPSGDAGFGTASHRLVVDGSRARRRSPSRSTPSTDWFGTIEQIGPSPRPCPGRPTDVRSGRRTRRPVRPPLLDLRDGRYPSADDEVALTDDVADVLGVDVGSTASSSAAATWTVVGLVENPEDLGDEFALVGADGAARPPDTVAILVDTTDDQVRARPGSGSDAAAVRRRARPRVEREGHAPPSSPTSWRPWSCCSSRSSPRPGSWSWPSGASGSSGCWRRPAPPTGTCGWCMVANGAVVGAVAAVVGHGAGLLTWVAVAPRRRAGGRAPDRPLRRAVVADRRRDAAGGVDRDRGVVVAGPGRGPDAGHGRAVRAARRRPGRSHRSALAGRGAARRWASARSGGPTRTARPSGLQPPRTSP